MKRFQRSPMSASIFCSSLEVPSVVVTIACVSPRWNIAEPWTRGRRPTSVAIARIVFIVAAVDALVLGEHVLADDDVLALLELGLDELLVLGDLLGAEVLREGLDHRVLGGLVAVVALLLVLDERGLDDLLVDERGDHRGDLGRELLRLERALRLADGGAELLDELR